MKINSHNEWDTLREVIVGNAESMAGLIFSSPEKVSETNMKKAYELAHEAYPDWLIKEVDQDLNELIDVIKDFGAKVLRPSSCDIHKIFSTGNWSARGTHVYNMRDLHLIVGNTVIESPSQDRHRYFEAMGLYDIWYDYFKEGFRWINAPKPRLVGDYKIPFYENGKKLFKLAENEILFEAANTVRMGKDLLYLVSASGNYLGAKWLQSVLGDEYRVHTTEEIYRSSHIDSTVLALRPGVVLLNAYRVNEQNCPHILKKCERIWINDILPFPKEILDFHRVRTRIQKELAEMGIENNADDMSSEWIGMNVFSLDPNTVVVDKRQTKLIETLRIHKFDVITINFGYSYFMGGIHCSTLDTVRDSKLESYFD